MHTIDATEVTEDRSASSLRPPRGEAHQLIQAIQTSGSGACSPTDELLRASRQGLLLMTQALRCYERADASPAAPPRRSVRQPAGDSASTPSAQPLPQLTDSSLGYYLGDEGKTESSASSARDTASLLARLGVRAFPNLPASDQRASLHPGDNDVAQLRENEQDSLQARDGYLVRIPMGERASMDRRHRQLELPAAQACQVDTRSDLASAFGALGVRRSMALPPLVTAGLDERAATSSTGAVAQVAAGEHAEGASVPVLPQAQMQIERARRLTARTRSRRRLWVCRNCCAWLCAPSTDQTSAVVPVSASLPGPPSTVTVTR